MNPLKPGDKTFLPQFDCFVKVNKRVILIDGKTGFIVSNKFEGINRMLVRDVETYGTIARM